MRASRVLSGFVFLAVVSVPVLFGAEGGSERGVGLSSLGSLNPKAPPETSQFAFAIGEWSCKTRRMQPDGKLVDGPGATWTFYYILDGWAIQDDWSSEGLSGSRFQGTNIRSFNPKTGHWDNRWLQQGNLQWKYYSSEQVGSTMVMMGGEGKDARDREFIDRNTFHDITEDSWSWRKDRSYDGGETWIEGVAMIDAVRVSRAR